MKLATPFMNSGLDHIKGALNGGTLVIYSVARPASPDRKVERSGVLATFTFASPAFGPSDSDAATEPLLAANPVPATGTGTPGFARAFTSDGSPVADFSAGPGGAEVKLSEVSTTPNYPVTLTKLILPAADLT
jgi:hypothetical protein